MLKDLSQYSLKFAAHFPCLTGLDPKKTFKIRPKNSFVESYKLPLSLEFENYYLKNL